MVKIKLAVISLVVVVLLSGCDCNMQSGQCSFISPVPTPTPDLDIIQSDLDDWLEDYRGSGLW